jgi:uncharacterized protein YkwD
MHRRLLTALAVAAVAVLFLVTLVSIAPLRVYAQQGGAPQATVPEAVALQATAPQTAAPLSADTSTPPATKTPEAESKTVRMLGGTPQDVQLTKEEQRFVELTNADRKAHGVPPVTVAPLLVKIAREKSKEMHDLNYWGHVSPVTDKRTAMKRVLYYLPEPPTAMIVGENLYYCSQVRVDEGEKAFMNSPTHRANILKPEYQYVGIGAYTAADGRFWTTEVYLQITY